MADQAGSLKGSQEKTTNQKGNVNHENGGGDDSQQGKSQEKKKFRLTPEEQDIAYELKAQVFRNIEVQNQKIKTELALHVKRQELTDARKVNKRLQDEASLSRTNALKLMHMFERKAKEANDKLREMQKELQKSQQFAKNYQDLYEGEVRKRTGATPKSAQSSGNKESDNQSIASMSPARVNDILRRHEIIVCENENLKLEIQRLKTDNADLIKKVKHAEQRAHQNEAHLVTSEAARRDLQKRLEKEQKQHQQLQKSLTKQASDWLQTKKQLQNLEEEYRWSNCGPVSVLGAEQRTHSHQGTKNVYLPRKMHPVEQWSASK